MVKWCPEGLTVEPRFEVRGYDSAVELLEALGIDDYQTGTVTAVKDD